MATRKEVLDNIRNMENKGEYNEHVDPFDPNAAYPVTPDFPYVPPLMLKLKYMVTNFFITYPFIAYDSIKEKHLRVFGRENLKGIKSAMVTSNHVYMFDCLSCIYALHGHKVYVTAADFNNLKGELGNLMRAGGMMPISGDLKVMRHFDAAITYYLRHNKYILFYPEQGMWWYYEKPRPFKNGAFHYAVKNNVPVIPIFITYRYSDKKDAEGLAIRYSDLHIMKPIYPLKNISEQENVEYMRKKNHELCVEKYEEVYRKPYVLRNYEGDF